MRENRIDMLNGREIMTVTTNLERIESMLGHPIPAGCIDINILKDGMLSPAELNRIVVNISRIEATRSNSSKGNNTLNMLVAFIFLLGVTGVIRLVEFILGIHIL